MLTYTTALVIGAVIALFNRAKAAVVSYFGIITWGLLAFRNLHMGLYDTLRTYYDNYNRLTWPCMDEDCEVWGNGPLYNVTVFVTKQLSHNYHVVVAVVAIPLVIALCYVIQKYTESTTEVLIAFIAFYSFIFFYAFYLMRQMFAAAFLLGLAIPALIEKQHLKFFLGVILASLCHSTALVFILVYPFAFWINYSYLSLVLCILCSFIAKLFPNLVMVLVSKFDFTDSIVTNIIGGTYKAGTGALPGSWYLYALILVLATVLCRRLGTSQLYSSCQWCCGLGLVFIGWSSTIAAFARIGLYFILGIVLLLPAIYKIMVQNIGNSRVHYSAFIFIGIILIPLIYMFSGIYEIAGCDPYVPVWVHDYGFAHWESVYQLDPGDV